LFSHLRRALIMALLFRVVCVMCIVAVVWGRTIQQISDSMVSFMRSKAEIYEESEADLGTHLRPLGELLDVANRGDDAADDATDDDVVTTTTYKYINLFVYSDADCVAAESAYYTPLNNCIPNKFGLTSGYFARWTCAGTTASIRCRVRGYFDSACTKLASGSNAARVSATTECTAGLESFTAAHFSFTRAMPSHSTGLMHKLYPTSNCEGPHITFYIPDGTCVETGSASIMYECFGERVNVFTSTDCSFDDGYSQLNLSEYLRTYDQCVLKATGSSSLRVCGGRILT
jgi:hypothetical protein